MSATSRKSAAVPVPIGAPAATADEAWAIAERIGLPVVIKPQDGSQGRGVTVNITTREQSDAAFATAAEIGDVLVEIGEVATTDPTFGRRWREVWGSRPGAKLPLIVIRGETRLPLTASVELDSRLDRRIEPDPTASSRARRIRTGILQGIPRP